MEQEYIIKKIEKYNKFINKNPNNHLKYYKKINKYTKQLNLIGGNLDQATIQELLEPIKSMIKHELDNKTIVLDNCNKGFDLIKYNHEEILKLLKDIELLIKKLLEQRKKILDEKKDCEDKISILEKRIKYLETTKSPSLIILLKEKEKLIEENNRLRILLIEKEKEIIKLVERIKQIMAFIDYKIRVEDVDTDVSKFTRPIFKLLDDIDGALGKQEVNYDEFKKRFKLIESGL